MRQSLRLIVRFSVRIVLASVQPEIEIQEIHRFEVAGYRDAQTKRFEMSSDLFLRAVCFGPGFSIKNPEPVITIKAL